MDVSTEFNQCAFFLVSSDLSSSGPRNETLTVVVHILPDALYCMVIALWLGRLPQLLVISLSFFAEQMLGRLK
jgi:hypothetical protein